MKRIILTTLSLILFMALVVAMPVPPRWESAFGQGTLQATLSRQAPWGNESDAAFERSSHRGSHDF